MNEHAELLLVPNHGYKGFEKVLLENSISIRGVDIDRLRAESDENLFQMDRSFGFGPIENFFDDLLSEPFPVLDGQQMCKEVEGGRAYHFTAERDQSIQLFCKKINQLYRVEPVELGRQIS